MKIDRIELFHVAMPLITPWRTAYGEDAEIHSVLCRMDSGSFSAWGESSPLAAPCYSPEWAGGVFETARLWLAPQLLGRDIPSGEHLQERLRLFKANPFAKAALDTAWWALESRIQNQPVHRLLGAQRTKAPVGADFGVADSIDVLCDQVNSAVADGFPRIKLKYRPGWDAPVLEAVRQAQPTHPIHIDCNSGYRLADVDEFRRIDEFRLEMIEQPLGYDDVLDHAELQRQIETPICLDESIISIDRTRQALAVGACRYVNIKPGRVGGLTVAKQIHDYCLARNVPCWVGGMLESATGASLCSALAMLENFTYPADIFPSGRFYVEDLSDDPLELCRDDQGTPSVSAPLVIPDPNPARLTHRAVQHAVLD